MTTQNLTLSLQQEIIRRIKVIAAREGQSISGYIGNVLTEIVEREEGYIQAQQRHMTLLEEGADFGTGGEIDWARDELYDR